MAASIRRPQIAVLGSAEPGSPAYERAGEAGTLLADLGITVVSGCGNPATRVAAERAIASGGIVHSIAPHPTRCRDRRGLRRSSCLAGWGMRATCSWQCVEMPASSFVGELEQFQRFAWLGCTAPAYSAGRLWRLVGGAAQESTRREK
jgi:predicted Rossmann-fold nucleotide-binding protein